MPTPVIMPKFEMTQENATVVRWLIAEGDTTEQGDPILEVETDKVVMGVEAPAGGVLAGVTVREGDVVPVTEVIAYILQPGESLPDTPQKEVAAAPANIETTTPAVTSKATPVAVRVAEEAGVDCMSVTQGWQESIHPVISRDILQLKSC